MRFHPMSKPLTFSLRSCLAAAAVTSALLVGATGCGGSKPQQSSKQAASQRWNTARGGVLLTLARDQYSSGNFEKCRKTLDDALKLDADALARSRRSLRQVGNLSSASV